MSALDRTVTIPLLQSKLAAEKARVDRLEKKLTLAEGQRDIQVECTGRAQIKITELGQEVKRLQAAVDDHLLECEFCDAIHEDDNENISGCDKCGKTVCKKCWTSKETYPETHLELAEWETRCPECS